MPSTLRNRDDNPMDRELPKEDTPVPDPNPPLQRIPRGGGDANRIGAIYQNAGAPVPDINANGVRAIDVREDQNTATAILAGAFMDQSTFNDPTFYAKKAQDQEYEMRLIGDNFVPKAKHFMARYAWPALYTSLKDFRSRTPQENKRKAIVDRIQRPLSKSLATNYYWGSGYLIPHGPIAESSWTNAAKALWKNLGSDQHRYIDPAVRLFPGKKLTDAERDKALKEIENNMKILTRKSIDETAVAENAPTFLFIEPQQPGMNG